jgi:hypothetical protein
MKTLKYEEVYRTEYRDLEEARALIQQFLEKVYRASPLLASGRPNNIGFLPRVVPEIALLTCPFLYSPLQGYRSGLRSSFPAWPICLRLSAFGVPQYPRRPHDLLCPLLTSAARSR